MTTQYTSILKLALPVQGELSGTWGDVVNDNITSMVEEAIAGRAVIDSWTTNSHTLTSANGTTSESRCAMLEFTDTTVSLSGDATVVCPTAAKIYICKNDAGQKVTIKTSAGTGVDIADGQTMFVFCDGTNVVEAVTSMSSLKLGTAVTSIEVTSILDEDDLVSDSATALATQQSIKAYVDSQVTAQDLDFGGDSGTGSVDLDSQSLTIAGTSNEIETSAVDQTLTIGLPDAVTVTTSVTTPTVQVTDVKANDGTAAISIADTTGQTTITDAVLTTADINGGTADDVVIGGTTAAAGSFTTVGATGNITSEGQVITDTINEQTATSGVTVDGLLVKDTGIGVADASGTDVAGSDVTVSGGAGTGTGAGGELLFKVAPAGSTGSSVNALATGMKLDSTKSLYVDTINELTSAAGVTIDSVLLKDGGATLTGDLTVDTNLLFVDASEDKIGIKYDLGAAAGGEAMLTINSSGNGYRAFAFANSQTDATAKGGIIGGLPYDNADSIWTAFGLFDDNTHRRVFLGGGGWGAPEATSVKIYTASSYDQTNNAAAERVAFGNSVALFNSPSADYDFQVESVNNANMFFVDAGADKVSVGTGSMTRVFNVNSTTADSYIHFTNSNSAGGTGGGGDIGLYDDGTNPSAMLIINREAGGKIALSDNTNTFFDATSSGIIINENGADIDFRVESDNNTHMLFVDAGNDQVVVGESGNFYSKFTVVGGKTRSTGVPLNQLSVYDNSAMASSTGGSITLWGNYTTGGAPAEGASIEAYKSNSTSGNYQYGIWLKSRTHGGTMDDRLFMDQAQTVFNETGASTDFRVESDATQYSFFIDASENSGYGRVKISSSTVSSATSTQGGDADTYVNGLTIENNEASYTNGGLGLVNKYSWGYGSSIRWFNIYDEPGGTIGQTNRITSQWRAANEYSLDFFVMKAGIMTEHLSLGYNASVFNEDANDIDFRVESEGNSSAFFVDADQDTVHIGGSGGNYVANIYANTVNSPTGTLYVNAALNNSGRGVFIDAATRNSSEDSTRLLQVRDRHAYNALTVNVGGTVEINDDGGSWGDFRAESDGATHMLFVDAGNDCVNIASTQTEAMFGGGFPSSGYVKNFYKTEAYKTGEFSAGASTPAQTITIVINTNAYRSACVKINTSGHLWNNGGAFYNRVNEFYIASEGTNARINSRVDILAAGSQIGQIGVPSCAISGTNQFSITQTVGAGYTANVFVEVTGMGYSSMGSITKS